MRRLIWGFAGRTYHIVGNLMWGLISRLCKTHNIAKFSLHISAFYNVYWRTKETIQSTFVMYCMWLTNTRCTSLCSLSFARQYIWKHTCKQFHYKQIQFRKTTETQYVAPRVYIVQNGHSMVNRHAHVDLHLCWSDSNTDFVTYMYLTCLCI